MELVEFVDAVHPDPYRFVEPAAVRSRVSDLSAHLDREGAPKSGIAAALEMDAAMHELAALFHDGHLRPAPSAFAPELREGLLLLPMVTEVTHDGVFAVVAADERLVGATVVAIDGRPIDEILARLSSMAIYDGVNLQARDAVLSQQFSPLYALAYGVSNRYAIEMRPAGADEVVTVNLDGLGAEQLHALAQRRPMGRRVLPSDSPWPQLTRLDDGTALISLPTFGVPDGEAYEQRIAEVVQRAADAPRIVIDLRHNEGGFRTHGAALLSHLVERRYTQWRAFAVAVREIPRPFTDRVAGAFGVSLEALGGFPQRKIDGLHRVGGDPLAERFTPREPALRQPVAVLVDGLTRSAANEFVLALEAARPETVIVGQEVGETCQRHTGEIPVIFTTATTQQKVLMSLVDILHVEVPRCRFGHGLPPDVAVRRDQVWVHARLRGEDPELDAAVAALRRSRAAAGVE